MKIGKSRISESVLNYLSAINKELLIESEEVYKSSRYGLISIVPRIGENIEIGNVNFRDVEKLLDQYIKPNKNGIYRSVTITIGYDRKRNKNGVVFINIILDNASYKDLSTMSGIKEIDVKESGYPEEGFGIRVTANPYLSDIDTKPNGFYITSKDRKTELKYRARYDIGMLSSLQKLIRNNIFTNVRSVAVKLTDILDKYINN